MTRALDVANDLSTFQSKYNNGVLDNVTLTNSIVDTTTTTNGTFTLSGNLKIPENYGIDFNNYGSEDSNSATTVGSNLLDDYEEGTWTPALVNGGSPSYSLQTGRYRKVGSLVWCTFRLIYSGASDQAGTRLGGLPFATADDQTNRIGWEATNTSVGSLAALGATGVSTTVIYSDRMTTSSSYDGYGQILLIV